MISNHGEFDEICCNPYDVSSMEEKKTNEIDKLNF